MRKNGDILQRHYFVFLETPPATGETWIRTLRSAAPYPCADDSQGPVEP